LVSESEERAGKAGGQFRWWTDLPLYVRILIGLVLGVAAGLLLGPSAEGLDLPARLILRLLGALAPPLILLAVVHALLTAEIQGAVAWRLGRLLLQNTLTAIVVGLAVANALAPGRHAHLPPPPAVPEAKTDLLSQFLDNIPDSLLRPFVDNRVIGVVLIALAFGVAARRLPPAQRQSAEQLASLGFSCILTVLSWVIAFVPLAVFGKVASIVGSSGFGAFAAIGLFVVAVLLALSIQAVYYLTRIRFGSWVRPLDLLSGTRDALIMAFSTGSSTVTMPVTYDRLCHRVGLRQRSASLGALVGSNFNNDGTALYEAMAALFVAQMLGAHLSLLDQLLVVVTSVVASVGAAGIPEAGLVTMTLVFSAVKLPTEYIALLLSVDWFLDRCRTAINVLGDMNVACLLDGHERE
jgi:DAACS family dicarboxylate/amino acid:cation (Na+ or H+) symporter